MNHVSVSTTGDGLAMNKDRLENRRRFFCLQKKEVLWQPSNTKGRGQELPSCKVTLYSSRRGTQHHCCVNGPRGRLQPHFSLFPLTYQLQPCCIPPSPQQRNPLAEITNSLLTPKLPQISVQVYIALLYPRSDTISVNWSHPLARKWIF